MQKEALSKGFIYLLLIIGGLLMLLPFVWMISTSLKAANEVMIMPPKWIPSDIQWGNYITAWSQLHLLRYTVNSVIVLVASTIGELITTIFAAYAFSRINFYGRDIIFSILLGTMMVPGEVLLIPNFVTLSNLGWIDHYQALIVPWLASVFSIFLLRQFFLSIPKELSFAAKIDGCSDFRFLMVCHGSTCKTSINNDCHIKSNWQLERFYVAINRYKF